MTHYLLLIVSALTALVFAGFGAFVLCFVCLQPKGTCKALTPVEHMALDLSNQAAQLSDLRLWMFLEWLQCHCHQLPAQSVEQDRDEIRKYLRCWLDTFATADLQAEYELIAGEIGWWKDADEKTLLRCISKEFAGRNLLR
jgi:hypothetical protein